MVPVPENFNKIIIKSEVLKLNPKSKPRRYYKQKVETMLSASYYIPSGFLKRIDGNEKNYFEFNSEVLKIKNDKSINEIIK